MIDKITEILVWGTLIGGSYSLVALGLTLMYGVARVINLAHGALYMLGPFLYYGFSFMILNLGLDPWIVLLITLIFTGILGAILYRITIHPILGDEVAQLVVTITLAVLLANLVLILFGSNFVRIISPFGEEVFVNYLGVALPFSLVISGCLSVSLFAVIALFINKFKIGKAMKALSQDRESAMLMGINVNRLLILTMFLSTVMAALAGFMATVSSLGLAIYYMWFNPLTASFAIVVLGGLGSIKGSLIGSFVIAYAEQAVRTLFEQGGAIISVAPLAAMIIVLLVRPKGLFGKRVEMEE
jgi:branched-chain amino acid transport system permease protein